MIGPNVVYAILLVFVQDVVSEIVPTKGCPSNGNTSPVCNIQELRVSPCKEIEDGKPCKFERGSFAELVVDFKPDFVATNMEATLAWDTGMMDMPLLGMDTEACKYTQCPTKKGQTQTYKYALKILDIFPCMKYTVKFRLQDTADKNNECCFEFNIKIKKPKSA